MDKCIACGLCAQKCPRKVRDEFNLGLNDRTSAYIKYGQSVPLKYAIDGQTCIYLTRGKCKACEKFCPTSAINFEDKEEVATLNVGAVILAPGFKPFDPSGFDFYGYKRIPDVVTSLEYERLLSSSGPCMGHLVRPSDRTEPRRIAWIQCVGSRNTNQCNNGYCSSVCCMYAIKEALVTARSTPPGRAGAGHLLHGHPQPRQGLRPLLRGGQGPRACASSAPVPHSIEAGPGNHGVSMRYTHRGGRGQGRGVRPGVLSVGLEPAGDARELARIFGSISTSTVSRAPPDFAPVSTNRAGVFVAGAFQAPKAIPRFGRRGLDRGLRGGDGPDLRPAASSRAPAATRPSATCRRTRRRGSGVFVCSCGINIAGIVNVDDGRGVRPHPARRGARREQPLQLLGRHPGAHGQEDRRAPAEPRRHRRLHAADARAALPGHAARILASTPTWSRWPTSATRTPGCTSASRNGRPPRPRTRCAWRSPSPRSAPRSRAAGST